MRSFVVAVVASIVFLACVAPDDAAVGTIDQAIRGGDEIDRPEHKAIVFIMPKECSGTFIHPRYIMTAAHCLPKCASAVATGCVHGTDWHISESGDWVGVDGPLPEGWVANDGLLANGGGATYAIDRVHFPTSADYGGVAPPDVAILHTTTPFRGQVIPVMEWGWLPTSGSICDRWDEHPIRVAGYSGNGQPRSSYQWRRRWAWQHVGCDVDDDRFYDLLDDGVMWEGDSGGPALWDLDGRLQVGGVIHGGRDGGDVDRITFVPRGMLDRLAAQEPLCNGAGWDDCVSAMEPAPPPGKPRSLKVRGTTSGIEVTWIDDSPSATTRVRVSRSPAFPGGWVSDTPAVPDGSRLLLDPWRAETLKTGSYVYQVCAVNTLGEQLCDDEPYIRPLAVPPTGVSADGSAVTRVDVSYSAPATPDQLPGVRIYRNDLSGFRTHTAGYGQTFADTTVSAYRGYTYSVCTVSTVGEEACTSAGADTYGGTPQCRAGTILCDGVCVPSYQCGFWE